MSNKYNRWTSKRLYHVMILQEFSSGRAYVLPHHYTEFGYRQSFLDRSALSGSVAGGLYSHRFWLDQKDK